MTHDELLDRMTCEEFAHWVAEYGIEPWGGERGDVQSGIIASTVHNSIAALHSLVQSICGSRRMPKFAKAQEFIPDWGKPPKPKPGPWEAFKAIFKIGGADG